MSKFIVLLDSSNTAFQLDEVVDTIRNSGGAIIQTLLPSIIFAEGDESLPATVSFINGVLLTSSGRVDNAGELGLDDTASLIVEAWNVQLSPEYQAAKAERPYEGASWESLGQCRTPLEGEGGSEEGGAIADNTGWGSDNESNPGEATGEDTHSDELEESSASADTSWDTDGNIIEASGSTEDPGTWTDTSISEDTHSGDLEESSASVDTSWNTAGNIEASGSTEDPGTWPDTSTSAAAVLSVPAMPPALNATLTGNVAVGLVIVDGPAGSSAAFDPGERLTIAVEVSQGFDIHYRLAPKSAHLVFMTDIQQVTINLDPATVPTATFVKEQQQADIQSIEPYWRDPALNALGLPSGVAGVREYIGWLLNRQWSVGLTPNAAYVVFFTKYNTGWFAYAGSNRVTMQYTMLTQSGGWGNPWTAMNIDRIFAHETGHIFGAPDEYKGCSGGGAWGYRQWANGNCEKTNPSSVPCIMRENTEALCAWTPGHLGWV
jgi:hypothetical protein